MLRNLHAKTCMFFEIRVHFGPGGHLKIPHTSEIPTVQLFSAYKVPACVLDPLYGALGRGRGGMGVENDCLGPSIRRIGGANRSQPEHGQLKTLRQP